MSELALTKQQKKIIEASVTIGREQPTDQDKAFLARQMVQTTLPHADPGNVPVWSRTNGNLTLIIQQGYNADQTPVGHPYGIIPRLLLYWMTTEALRTKKRRLELGSNLAEFMKEIGLDPKGKGKRSDRVRLEEQMNRLFSANIRFEVSLAKDGRTGKLSEYMRVARRAEFWWTPKQPEQEALWQSYIELDPDFFKAITASPIPMDIRALRAIKNSALALDLYSLLTFQAFSASASDRPRFMDWRQLQAGLGTDYADQRNFRKEVKSALLKIQTVYPNLVIGERQGGIEVMPGSRPAIEAR
jgi:hypothetical protein